ncbi:MAG: cache domain-containing protein, partial [Burkholderiaceae bacterium]
MIKSSLRRQLVLPFVSMVAIVALAIGWVSFQATAEAVGALMQRVLLDMVGRVGGVTGNHLVEARTVLEALAPEPHGSAPPFVASPATLEDQFWSLSVSGQPEASGRAVYFGGADGSFIGIDRTVPDRIELYLRQPGELQRRVYLIDAPGDRERKLRSDDYDPRQRPWYRAAAAQPQAKPVWSPVYHDFSNARSTLTLARAVYRADRQLAGVVATDLPLAALTAALQRLKISEHGVVFLLDADGRLVASSSA